MFHGILLSIASSCLFAAIYYYSTLLTPLNGVEVFGWRMALTLPFVSLFMLMSKDLPLIKSVFTALLQRPSLIFGLILSSFLIGIQQWLFMWAPLNGQALEVSIGYFLLPLSMLLVGRFIYHERLSCLQWLAALCALLGVSHEIYLFGGFPWEAALVALGFPCYFILRRKLGTNHLGGFWLDLLLMLPVAGFIITRHSATITFPSHVVLYLLLIGLAILSATSFMFYIIASRLLPLSLFGLLGYVEPVLLVAISLYLGEQIRQEQWLTYIPIWLAVGLLTCNGILKIYHGKQQRCLN
ncbi:EamA family transporter RarD [Agarivorans sp. QJM3NY_25]|uniref:EamA family transporter RarD n=1 Tax=Agarivorans sp. QJM3NY_25 TaxID=3421430 RepID=UPI003D7D28F7